jgi:hypothetical protein
VLGATNNLQGRVSNGVTVGDECDTAALASSGSFIHIEQDPDVREEPLHIVTALLEAQAAADDTSSPCAPTPEMGCREAGAGKAKLGIKDKEGAERDKIGWKWSKGAATALEDFSDAVGGSSVFQVCLYDASVNDQPLLDAGVAGGALCDGAPCWKTLGTKGYSYKDKAGESDGITSLKLKSGVEGKAQVQARAAGANLAFAGLPLAPPVVLQLLIDDGDTVECWQTTFSEAPLANEATKFKAKQ